MAKMAFRIGPDNPGDFRSNRMLENDKNQEQRNDRNPTQTDRLAERTVCRIIRIMFCRRFGGAFLVTLENLANGRRRASRRGAVDMRLRDVRYPEERKEKQRGDDTAPRGRITLP